MKSDFHHPWVTKKLFVPLMIFIIYLFILGDKKWSPLMSMGLTKNDMGGVHGYSLFGRLKRIHVVQMGD
jgi:hypothetical protein